MTELTKRQIIANLTDEQIEQYVNGELELPIRMGYELEFQRLNGKKADDFTHECDCETEYDYDRMREDADRDFRQNGIQELWADLKSHQSRSVTTDILLNALWDKYGEHEPRLTWSTVCLVANHIQGDECINWLEEWRTGWIDNWEEGCDMYPYAIECDCGDDDGFDTMANELDLPCGARIKSDGSVSGGEITSDGPNIVAELLRQTKLILDNNDLTIDKGCSYHLHFSIDGMRHTYGQHVQAEAMRYLADNIHDWPEALVDRMNDLRYYKAEISKDKYTMVNFNSDYSTWEFRLFGNIDNIDDAKVCFILAIKAMRHVYRVLENMVPSLRSLIAKALDKKRNEVCLTHFFSRYALRVFDRTESFSAILERIAVLPAIDEDTADVA